MSSERVLTQQELAQNATQYLVDSAPEIGEAKASLVRAEAMLRHIKALAMKASDERTASGQEREAYASANYSEAIEAVYEASKRFETLKAKREAASARIDLWRSMNANQRAAERGYSSA